MKQLKREAPATVALRMLGQGFLVHPGNPGLRAALHDGSLPAGAFHGELLRCLFRLLVSLAAEARGLLGPARLLESRPGASSGGWEVLKARALGAPFSPEGFPHLSASRLGDAVLEAVLRELRRVDFGGGAAEALGGAYETLLELVPEVARDGSSYGLAPGGGERRRSGSYFTPGALVQVLLDGALEPVIAETVAQHPGREPEALLGLALVDPACGTGHILLAAARRLAAHVQRWRAARGEGKDRALWDVACHCIHGVDLDPLAVELCRAALWLESAGQGRSPDAFDVRIRHGHALLGAPADQDTQAAADAFGEALAGPGHALFHWHLQFPEVFARGGFDVVLGNPPWIAHAGRAAQRLAPGVKRFYAARYEAFAGYPTTHGVFASAAAGLLREGGRLGLVVPSSLSELGGYVPTRRAHDRLCVFERELTDFGEGRFPGVTQPSMALVSRRVAGGRTDAEPGEPWPVERPELTAADRALLRKLAALPTLPPGLFGERGLQSDGALAAHFSDTPVPVGRFTVPLREGTDVREFELLPPRLHVDREALGSRLRPAEQFRAVRLLVRQTARYPIAALSDGEAFRNSLLAGFELSGWPAAAVVALLNSALMRWHHFMRFRDARQPVLPQVKVGHLRAIPAPPGGLGARWTELERAASSRESLDRLVAELYGLSEEEARAVGAWHAQAGPRRR